MNRSHLNKAGQETRLRRWVVILFSGVAIAWGSLSQWGGTQEVEQIAPGATSDEGVLSAGASHTCGIKRDGTLTCWGDNSHGQLSAIPSGPFMQISAGTDRTCGVKREGTLACWGDNRHGQLTNLPSGTFTQVSVAVFPSCALKSDGTVVCWENEYAPLVFVPLYRPKNAPISRPKIQGRQTAFSSGTFTQISGPCGVKSDGTLACWHYNWSTNTVEPSTDIPGGTFTQISVGARYACGVKSDGTLACWQYLVTNTVEPFTNIPGGTFTQVSVGARHACGVKREGTLACWGDNSAGQLTNIPSGTFTQVSAGDLHTCALKSDGSVVCWGDNSQGQLNNIPTAVFGHPAGNAEPPTRTASRVTAR